MSVQSASINLVTSNQMRSGMKKWEGVAWAVLASISHSCIDATRKYASRKLSNLEIVALVGVFDALFLNASVFSFRLITDFSFLSTSLLAILILSSVLKVVAVVLYQRALSVSPLSVCVPYLAFVPVLIIVTSYMLVGEVPNLQGFVGVMVVTAGGYFLALKSDSPSLIRLEEAKSKPELSTSQSLGRGGEVFESIASPMPDKPSKKLVSMTKTASDSSSIENKNSLTKQANEVVINAEENTDTMVKLPLNLSSRLKEISPACLSWLRLTFRKVVEVLKSFRNEEGPLLMLAVATLLSFTNSLDKLGIQISPSCVVFASLQRIFMAVPPLLYLIYTRPSSFRLIIVHCPILSCISIFEILAIIGYLKSIEILLVSYSIAIKRTNILISLLVGCIVFKENIFRRLPFVLLMLAGMIIILFS